MLKVLLKKQMMEVFRTYFYDAKKNRARSRSATILWMIFFVLVVVGVLGGLFTFLATSLCGGLVGSGVGWLYFIIFALLSICLGVFGSVFNTYAGLYLAKDNDLLLSMPIPVRDIMAARLLNVYLLGLLYAGVVYVPGLLVYWFNASLSFSVIVGGLVLLVLISIFVLVLSCALGWVVARISHKLKHKSLITVFLSLAFLILYYVFYFKASMLMQTLLLNAVVYGEKIRGSAYVLYLLGRIGEGDIMGMLLYTLVVSALFALTMSVISRSFLRMATSTGASVKAVYKERSVKPKTPFAALVGKEFGRLTSSPNYLLNCGLGILLIPAAGVFLLIKGSDVMAILTEIFGSGSGAEAVLTATLICFCVSMNDMAVPSFSLEGSSFWIARSLPVTERQILWAKGAVQLILTMPAVLFCGICAAVVVPGNPALKLLVAIQPLSCVLLLLLFGLVMGLVRVNVHWTSEISVVKQSMAVLIVLFGGFIYAAAVGGIYLFIGYHIGASLYLLAVTAVTLGLCAPLFWWLNRRGPAAVRAIV